MCRYSIGEVLAVMQPEENDDVKRFGPPLDFSFKEIQKMADVTRTTPREGPHSYVTVAVTLPEDISAPKVSPGTRKPENLSSEEAVKQPVKYCSKAIRLSNNSISSFDGFSRAMQSVIDMPELLEWIDLSFNDFTKINEVILVFKNLKVLYLHANYIEDIGQVDKLASLPQLKTLTLHGNLMDEKKGYRQYVITTIPHLQYLDFSRITRADREKATVWKKLKIVGAHHKKKKKPAAE